MDATSRITSKTLKIIRTHVEAVSPHPTVNIESGSLEEHINDVTLLGATNSVHVELNDGNSPFVQ